MFKIYFRDVKDFNTLASLNDVSYFEITLYKEANKAVFTTNNSYVFGDLTLPCSSTASETGDLSFRISVELLKGLGICSYCEIELNSEGLLDAYFFDRDDRRICKSTFEKQTTQTDSFEYKIRICEDTERMSSEFNVDQLKSIVKVGKENASIVSVENRLAVVKLPALGGLFKTTNIGVNFSASADVLSKLMSINTNLRAVQNFIYAENNGIRMLATMTRLLGDMDYEIVKSQPAIFTATIDFSNVLSFINKFKTNTKSIIVDIESQTCSIEYKDIQYVIDIEMSGSTYIQASKIKTIIIPEEILVKVLRGLKISTLDLKISRVAILLEKDGVLIAFSRTVKTL